MSMVVGSEEMVMLVRVLGWIPHVRVSLRRFIPTHAGHGVSEPNGAGHHDRYWFSGGPA
jgi:hypothetical protein